MVLLSCNVETDSRGRELAAHGAAMFPIACYDENFAEHLVPWHWHEEFEVILIMEGCAHVHVESQIVAVQQGDALLINAGVLHSIHNGMPETARCHSMVFHPRLIGGSIDSVFWQKLVYPVTHNQALRCRYFDHTVPWQKSVISDMAQAWQADTTEPEDYENTVRYLLSHAFHTMNRNSRMPAKEASEKDALAAERTKIMMQYICEHYAEEISLEQIAASAAVSKSVCLRSFRQVIGTTPVRYLLRYRLDRAAELLLRTDRKGNEIAVLCGFSDISYFTKCFREYKGCTPLAYRKAAS